jgi:hypothetical protein
MIRNVTEKEFTYRDSFYSSKTQAWFTDTVFDGTPYRVVTFSEEGIMKLFKKYPLEQKEIPTQAIKFTHEVILSRSG